MTSSKRIMPLFYDWVPALVLLPFWRCSCPSAVISHRRRRLNGFYGDTLPLPSNVAVRHCLEQIGKPLLPCCSFTIIKVSLCQGLSSFLLCWSLIPCTIRFVVKPLAIKKSGTYDIMINPDFHGDVLLRMSF